MTRRNSIELGITGGRAQVRSMTLSVLSQRRSMPQLTRKIYHCAMGLLCFAAYAFFLTREQALLLLASIGGVWVLFDLLRLRFSAVNHVALTLFGRLMRREELKSVSGNSFYILGLFVLVLAFSKPMALFGCLFLAIGDPTAAVVGTMYGRHKIFGRKSWEGALANFAASGLAAFCVSITYFQLSLAQGLVMAVLGGFASMFAELCPLPIDDNFSIPVLSAAFLTAAMALMPII